MGALGSISERKRADGTIAYKAEIVVRKDGVRHKLSPTFDRQAAARHWIKRREEEITRLTWCDYEPHNARVLVRDMKQPGEKSDNDMWSELPSQAMQIIDAMPRQERRIFPYTADAIGAAFTRACKVPGIGDLHFHDLRHGAVSRLFEMGRTIPQVASVSGHRSWQSLQRNSHLRSSEDKWEDWKWLQSASQ